MKIDVKVPAVGESVQTAIIGSWEKSNGDIVQQDDILVLLETDKASMEVPAEHEGQLEILTKEEEEVQVGTVIARIDTSKKAPKQTASPAPPKQETSPAPPTPEEKKEEIGSKPSTPSFDPSQFSPSARHALLEKKLDPASVQGTGKGGRVTKLDVLQTSTKPPSLNSTHPLNRLIGEPEIQKEKMTTIRKRIAERLVHSQQSTATLTTFNEVNMSKIISIRKEYQELFQRKYQIKLGFMGFFIKSVIQALKYYPKVGAQIENDHIVYSNHCHIGIAVSTDKGLIVPVIKYVDQMNIVQIEKAVLHFAEKAKTRQIRPDDLTGGIFTISNGGIFGSLLSTPILNPPESGILGMHTIQNRPVAIDGKVVIQPMMYLALSYDHRMVDGKESVGFLMKVKECIEDPTRILIDI